MLISILFFFILSLITISFGNIFQRIILTNNNIEFDIGERGIIGFLFLTTLSISIHFFLPIDFKITLLILIISILYFFINIKFFLDKKNLLLLYIALFLFLGICTSLNHPDFEWYHLPYLNYLKDFKIIFGIANVNDFLGYSHTWNDLIAILRLPLLNFDVSNLSPFIFIVFIAFSILKISNNTKNTSVKVFIYLILIFMISKYYKVFEYGAHIPPTFLAFLVNIYFFSLVIDDNQNKNNLIFKILIFSFFAIYLRINYLILLPIIIYLFCYHIKYFLNVINFNKITIFILLSILILFIKNFINTGCLYYPINSTCFSKEIIQWSITPEFALERYDLVKALSKGWSSHIIIEGNLSSRLDYFQYIEIGKILSPTDYLQVHKLDWYKYWIETGDAKKILNNILILFFCFFILFFINMLPYPIQQNKNDKSKYLILFLVFFLQIILCFVLSPQSIYGADVASIVFFASILTFLLRNIDITNKKTIYSFLFLFLLSTSYYQTKNFFRLYDEILNNKISIFKPLVTVSDFKIEEDYYKMKFNDFDVNVKKKISNRHEGLPDHCANIPMICLPYDRNVCVKNIKSFFNYIIIIGNDNQCLKHLKEKYFY